MSNQQYDNTNRGVLFTNDRKTAINQPDYKGNINVNGVEFWISAWVKDSRSGQILSLSVNPKDQNAPVNRAQPSGARQLNPVGGAGQAQQGRQASQEPPMDFDDDIPF